MWSGEKPGIQGPRFCSCQGPRQYSWPVTMGLCFLLSEGVELKELMFSTGLESSSCVVFVYGSWIYLKSSHRQEFLPLGSREWVERVSRRAFVLPPPWVTLPHLLLSISASDTSQAHILLPPSWLWSAENWERTMVMAEASEMCSLMPGSGKF